MARRYKTRKFLSIEELNTVWRQWRDGATSLQTARFVGASDATVRFVIVRRGGIAPPPRRRAPTALSLRERDASPRDAELAHASRSSRSNCCIDQLRRRSHSRSNDEIRV